MSVTESSLQVTQQKETGKDADEVQTISIISDNIEKCDKQKRRNDELEKKTPKIEDVLKTKTIIQPQAVWVQFQFGGSPGYAGGFDYDPSSRNSFLRIVFTIVFIMLIITAGVTAFIYMTPDIRSIFLQHSMYFTLGGGIVMMILSYAIACVPAARSPPCNFIILLIALAALTCICAAVTARYSTQLIIFALIATLITVFVCLLLAYSSFDFTKFYIYIIAIATAFMAISAIISIALFIMKQNIPILRMVILVIGTLINVVILIMELQMILGGKTVEMDENEYVLAAFMLYTSIVDIFIRFVQMCGLIDQFLE